MTEEQPIRLTDSPTDSIELSRNAKGEPSWSIKKYYKTADGWQGTLDQVEEIDKEMRRRFKQ